MLASGVDIALVSDAGTPAISDPGFLLSRYCREQNIAITCLPGATAFVPALVMSGLPADKFHYEGFLPTKKGRQTRIEALCTLPNTIVLYESPHRIVKCLEQLIPYFSADREATLCREISKLHEEVLHGSLGSILADLSARPSIKGEIALVIAGNTSEK
jgi:16S rRNA (cytidine1402-2'-O)-methyltransferase